MQHGKKSTYQDSLIESTELQREKKSNTQGQCSRLAILQDFHHHRVCIALFASINLIVNTFCGVALNLGLVDGNSRPLQANENPY